ncbi:MAG: site-specific DNA-methyltransferase [Firmicutes bacterium]|nr:site-specific DNA-methyltransferase [Bacillota bacterium]
MNKEDVIVPTSRIMQGDALTMLKTLPANSIDTGVTSPPYNKGEKNKGWLVKNVLYDSVGDKMDEQDYQQEQVAVLNELFRVIKPGGSFFYNHKIRWDKGVMIHPLEWVAKSDWVIRQELVWDRGIAANIRGWRFWQVEERIYWLYKPMEQNIIGEELQSKHALQTSIWRFAPEQKSVHPAPFPLQLPLRCIYSILDDKRDCVVIDPYMGSGTTLVAAKLLGHCYIGIDVSQSYIESTKERLGKCEREKGIWEQEMSKHIVKETFSERKERGLYSHHDKDIKAQKKHKYNQKSEQESPKQLDMLG